MEDRKINWISRDVQTKSLPEYLDFGTVKAQEFTDVSFKDAYDVTSRGELVAKYDDYKVGRDNLEYNASQQTIGDKWKNGLAKFGVKVGAGVIGGTVGTVDDAITLFKTGSLDAMMDSELSTYLDDVNTKVDNKLPNYYTQAEQDMNFGQSMLTANFWANDVLGGASFTAASILSEGIWAAATGGTSLITSTVRGLTSLMANMSKAKGASKLALMRNTVKATDVAGNLARTARFTMTSAGYEAKTEAFQFRKEMMDNAWVDFEKVNNRPPTEEEKIDIQNNIEEATSSLFGMNMAVVGASNLAILGKTFNIKSPTLNSKEWVNRNIFGSGLSDSKKAISATASQKTARKIYSFGKAPLTEGWEEGMQSALSNSAETWTKATYDPKYLENTMGMYEAFMKGSGETLTSKEGLKEIGIGMLIGLFTGTGISLTKGRLTQDFDANDALAKRTESYYEMYSPKQVSSMLAMAGRVQSSEASMQEATTKGDFNGQEQARASSMLAQITHAHNLGDTQNMIKEIEVSLQSMGTQDIMEEFGVDEQGALDIKESILNQYKTLSSEYSKNKDFANSFFNDDSSPEGLSREDLELLREGVAYELTLGGNTYNFNREIVDEIKKEIIDIPSASTEIDSILRSSLGNYRKKFVESRRQLQETLKKLDEVDSERRNTQMIVDESPEAKQSRLQTLNNLTTEIERLNADVLKYETEAKLALNGARLSNPYNKSDLELVTSQEILDSQNYAKEIGEQLEGLKDSNPQKAAKLSKLLDEYQRSSSSFDRYKTLLTQMSSPNLGFKGKGSIVKRIFGDKGTSEVTKDLINGLKGVVENIREGELVNTVLESSPEIRGVITNIKEAEIPLPITIEQTTKEKILASNPFLKTISETLPTEEQLEEFREKGNESSEDTLKVISNSVLLDTAMDEDVSLKDILEQERQAEAVPKEPKIKTVTEETVGEVVRTGDQEGNTGARREDLAQVYEGVQLRRDKEGDKIFGISLKGLLETIGVNEVNFLDSGSEVIKFSRDVEGKVGEVVNFNIGDEKIGVTVLPGRVLKIQGVDTLLESGGLKDYKYSYSNNSGYSFIYGQDGKPLSSDFNEVDYVPQEVYNLDKGDEITFYVDSLDPYNKQLMEDGTLSEEFIENNVKIYVTDSNGTILGDMKANRDTKGHPNFSLLRKNALAILKKGGGQVQGKGEVDAILMGTPNIQVGADGNAIRHELKVEDIVDFGTSRDGILKLKDNTQEVRNTFVKRGSFDVVVLKVGKQLVAFPVEIMQADTLETEVFDIVNSNKPDSKKVVELNALALKNGMKALLEYKGSTDNNLYDEVGEASELYTDFTNTLSNKPKPIKVETKEDLVQRASIVLNMNDRTFIAPKIKINLDTVVSNSQADPLTKSKVVSIKVVDKIKKGLDMTTTKQITEYTNASLLYEIAKKENDGTDFRETALREARKKLEEIKLDILGEGVSTIKYKGRNYKVTTNLFGENTYTTPRGKKTSQKITSELNKEYSDLMDKVNPMSKVLEDMNEAINKVKLTKTEIEAIKTKEFESIFEKVTELPSEIVKELNIIKNKEC